MCGRRRRRPRGARCPGSLHSRRWASSALRAPLDSKTLGGALIATSASAHASATVRRRLLVRASTTTSPRCCVRQHARDPRGARHGGRRLVQLDPAPGASGRGLDPLREAHGVVVDQRARRLDHRRRAAVVVRERDALQPGVGAIELEHPPHRRAPEPVQRLVVVTDGQQRVLRRGQDPDQQLLRGLDVLVLVHEHVLEPRLPARAERRVGAQRADGAQHQVVEVVEVLLGLVARVDAGDRLVARRTPTRCGAVRA